MNHGIEKDTAIDGDVVVASGDESTASTATPLGKRILDSHGSGSVEDRSVGLGGG